MLGLSAVFNSPPPHYLTQVLIPGTALKVRAEVLGQEFARAGAAQQLLLRYAGERMAHLSQRALCNGHHRVEARLCNWLLMVHDRVGDEALPLTHEQIARHLGVRRAGVSGIANSLRERGIIGYSRGHIRVTDRTALEASSCECRRAMSRRPMMARPLA